MSEEDAELVRKALRARGYPSAFFTGASDSGTCAA
jgi:hypothetical protein